MNSINLKIDVKSTKHIEHNTIRMIHVNVLVVTSLVITIGFIAVLLLHSLFQPTFSPENKLYLSSQGNEVIIQCEMESWFPVKFVWWQKQSNGGTEKLSFNDERFTILTNIRFGMMINKTAKSDSGTYICCIHSFLYGTIRCSSTLIVEERPVFTITPSYLDDTSNTIVLKCIIPRIRNTKQFMIKSVKWKRRTDNGIEKIMCTLGSDETKYMLTSTPPALQIMNSTGNDRGKYICHLSDGVEEWIADVVIDRPKFSVEENITFASVNELKILTYTISTSLPAMKRLKKKKDENEEFLEPTEVNDESISFEIKQTCLDDTGIYVCRATNSLGTGISTTKLFIGKIPVILVRELSYITQRKGQVIFQCDVSSDSKLTKLVWEKTSGNQFSLMEKKNDIKYSGGTTDRPSLTIKDVEHSDEGAYVCYATNDFGTAKSSAISLKCQPKFSPVKETYVTSAGNEVLLQCKMESYFPVTFIGWRKKEADGTETDLPIANDRYIIIQSDPFGIVINKVEKSDSGIYTCSIKSNSYGIICSSTTLVVGDQPVFAILPSYVAATSKTILLKCTIPSNQNQKQFMVESVIWKKSATENGKEKIVCISENDHTKYSITNHPPELKIINSTKNDIGKYICHLSDGEEERIADISIDRASISVETKTVHASKNEMKTFNFYISTKLPVTKELLKMQNEYESTLMPTEEQDTLMSFRIDSTCLNDTGKYICLATNSLGTRRSSIQLHVGDRPAIFLSQTSFTTKSQSEVTFHCKVSTDLELTKLIWEKTTTKSMSFIETSDCKKYSGGTTQCSSLTIKHVEPDDEGSYVCYATNDIGTTPSSTILLKLVESDLNDSVCSPLYTGKDADSSEEKVAQVALGKWEAEHARAKSKLLIDEELRVVLIGKTGSGKSATGNMIAGFKIFQSEMSGESVTKTTECKRVTVQEKDVLLIDTPGILDTESNEKNIELEIGKCVRFGAPGIHSILFVMPIGRITIEDIKVIDTFLGYFGRDRMEHHVIVVFTFGDLLQKENKTIEDYLQTVPKGVKSFLQRCGNRYVVFNNKLNQYKRLQQVHCLFYLITSHKYEKALSYYTDILFESAETDLRKREDEIQRHLVMMYNKRVEEMSDEIQRVTEQLNSLHELGDQAAAKQELHEQLQELAKKSEQQLDKTKQIFENKLSKVRDDARQHVEVQSVVSNLDQSNVFDTSDEKLV